MTSRKSPVSPTGKSANAPKKTAKKIKGKKLEERIAPGMIGGGMGVDPGMVDEANAAPPPADAGAGQLASGEPTDAGFSPSGEPSEGAYVEEHDTGVAPASEPSMPAEAAEAPAPAEFGEFDSGSAPEPTALEAPIQHLDFVEATDDGGFRIDPPEGVTVQDGAAHFPVEVANEHLPLPEGARLTGDGALALPVPEGTTMSPGGDLLSFPAGSVDPAAIPADLGAFATPDGAVHLPMPEQGMNFDPDTGTLTVDNHLVNEHAPDQFHVNADGSVEMQLPEGAEVQADGTIDVPAEHAGALENPPPPELDQLEWSEANADGSMSFAPPEGVSAEGGVLTIPHAQLELALPEMPHDLTVQPDGSLEVKMPEGTAYDAEHGTLTFPQDSVHMHELPDNVEAHVNPEGNLTVRLPEGVAFDPSSNTVSMNNAWANELCPDNVQIAEDGSVNVALPADTEFHADGTFTVPADDLQFLNEARPAFTDDVEWGERLPDGGYEFHPPDQFTVDDGTLTIPHDAIETHVPLPEEVTINADGTLDVKVPEGTTFDPDLKALTFPEGTVQAADVPEGVPMHHNPDGTLTVTLPEGMSFDSESGAVHMDNYWANEIAPPAVEITPDGTVQVELPANTAFHADGSFTVPDGEAEFLQDAPPSYVQNGPEWIAPNADGSFTVQGGEHLEFDPENHTATMSYDTVNEQFPDALPHDMQIRADGGIDIGVPEGTAYDPNLGTLTFPAGSVNPQEIPPGIDAHVQDDGTLAVKLPDGVSFDPETGTVSMNNYWANQVVPESIDIGANGEVTVDLPRETHFHGPDQFTVPEAHAGFLENPMPDYVQHGPDWISPNADGSVNFQPPPDAHVDLEANQMHMPVEQYHQHFPMPDGHQFHPDGGAQYMLPEGAQYSPGMHMVQMGPGSYDPQAIPHGFQPQFHPDGSAQFQLPPDVRFEGGAVQFSSESYNHYAAPGSMHLGPDGNVSMQLPSGTMHYPGSGFTVPPEHADFMEQPEPDYVRTGPDWADMNPDGSVSVTVPEGAAVDSAAGTVSFPHGMVDDLPIPPDTTINPDGSIDIKLPENASYQNGVLTLPPGEVDLAEMPAGIHASVDMQGQVHITLPPGITFDATAGTVHMDNYWANEVAPASVEIGIDGSVKIDLPDDTHFNGDGSFVVSAENAHFMDEGHHEHMNADYIEPTGHGSYEVRPPDGFQVHPQEGYVEVGHEHFDQLPHDQDFQLNPDGTANVKLPVGTTFDAATGTMTLPATENINDVPREIHPVLNADGTIAIKLPEGIAFDAGSNSVTLSNAWVNELTPPHVEVDAAGTVRIELPPNTVHYPDGTMVINSPEHFQEPPTIMATMPNGTTMQYDPNANTYHPPMPQPEKMAA